MRLATRTPTSVQKHPPAIPGLRPQCVALASGALGVPHRRGSAHGRYPRRRHHSAQRLRPARSVRRGPLARLPGQVQVIDSRLARRACDARVRTALRAHRAAIEGLARHSQERLVVQLALVAPLSCVGAADVAPCAENDRERRGRRRPNVASGVLAGHGAARSAPVSYTHLTLPTILLV